MSQVGQFIFEENIETLAGNTGDIVHPQVGNINIVGSGHVNVNGNNTTGTLTITADGGLADTITTDSGNAAPVLGVLRVLGGNNINTAGTGNTITVHLDDSIVQPVTNSLGTQGLYSLGVNRFMHNRGTNNTWLGESAGSLSLTVLSAVGNTGLGSSVMTGVTSGAYNVAAGASALSILTSGVANTALGALAGAYLNGSGNTLVGKEAGTAYVGTESYNINIGNVGTVGESNKIRIGTYGSGANQQDTAYIAGVVHATNGLVADAGNIVCTLGDITASAGNVNVTLGDVTISDGNIYVGTQSSDIIGNDIEFKKSRAGGVITSGDTLGNIKFSGFDGTSYDVASVITSRTSGTIGTGRVASDLEFWTSPDVAGIALRRMDIKPTGEVHIYAPDSGNTGLTIAGGGETITAGGLLVSAGNVVATLGNFTADAGNITATLGSVGAGTTVTAGTNLISTAGNLKLPTTSATVGQIQINSVPVFQTYGTFNTFVGAEAGNLTLTVANASSNVGVGANALNDLVGTSASQGYANVAIGSFALSAGTEIAACIALGYNSGTHYTTTENSNIVINNLGVTGESNVLRFGAGTGTTLGKLNKAFISGIYGISIGATAGVTLTDSSDQLGTISGSEGQILRMGSTKPAFSTATYPNTVSKGDVLVASAANVVDVVAGATTAGYVLMANGATSAPSFQALPASGIQTLAGDSGTATGSTVTIAGGSNITTSATSATVTVDLDNSITLSGDVTALNLKTSTAATNLTINGNTITSAGTAGADIDINLVAKGAGGLTFDGISTGYSDSQWHIRQSELQTTNATPTALVTIPLVEGEMITINATINGFQSDFTDACGATCVMTCYRPTGGNVTQVGEEIINVNSTSTAVISADVDTGTQSMIIYAAGVTSETWNWVSTHQYMFTKTNA